MDSGNSCDELRKSKVTKEASDDESSTEDLFAPKKGKGKGKGKYKNGKHLKRRLCPICRKDFAQQLSGHLIRSQIG